MDCRPSNGAFKTADLPAKRFCRAATADIGPEGVHFMSFSSDCKKELCLLNPEKPCCRMSELSALYMTLGSLNLLGRGKLSVQFTGESMAVARRVYTLLQKGLGPFASDPLRVHGPLRRHPEMRADAGADPDAGLSVRAGHDDRRGGRRGHPALHLARGQPEPLLLRAGLPAGRHAGRRHHDQSRSRAIIWSWATGTRPSWDRAAKRLDSGWACPFTSPPGRERISSI